MIDSVRARLWVLRSWVLRRWAFLGCGALLALVPATAAAQSAAADPESAASATLPDSYTETLPGTRVSFRMVPIPAPERKGEAEKDAPAATGFWMAECEITWEVYDCFVFGIDGARDREGDEVDAYTRPSKPYIPPDRGFGHEGYPVISASYRSAKEFCRWLSDKTGHAYRLPTVTEWRHAAAAGSTTRYHFGDDPAALGEYAWFDGNADWTTHPVRKKKPNAWGLYDVHGNAGEWCVEVTPEGKRKVVLCGGHFECPADEVATDALARPEESWQMSDPQIPKSRWWLSDAPFAGLRIIREFPAAPAAGETDAGTNEDAPAPGTPGVGTKEERAATDAVAPETATAMEERR